MRRFGIWGAVVAVFALTVSCRGGKPSSLPSPVYERPTLPEWDPPQEDQDEDPFADLGAMEGEWVVDDETAGGDEPDAGAPDASEEEEPSGEAGSSEDASPNEGEPAGGSADGNDSEERTGPLRTPDETPGEDASDPAGKSEPPPRDAAQNGQK